MKNLKQHLIDQAVAEIAAKENEIKESDEELAVLGARLKVEKKTLGMQDLKEHLKESFTYSLQGLETVITQDQQQNTELKKDLEMLKYRKAVIESQFTESELDQ
jgi:multidrug resistance efflux pump